MRGWGITVREEEEMKEVEEMNVIDVLLSPRLDLLCVKGRKISKENRKNYFFAPFLFFFLFSLIPKWIPINSSYTSLRKTTP